MSGMTDTHAPPVVRRRYGFHNLRNTMTSRSLEAAHLSMRAAGYVIYGTSENNHRDAGAHVHPDYRTLQAKPGTYRAGTAIHYRPDALELLTWSVTLLHLSRLFPSAKRAFTWAQFRDRTTGRRLTFVVVHLVPHADDDQHPGRVTDKPRGVLVHRSLRILAAFARSVLGPLVIVGDFNIDLRAAQADTDPDGLLATFRRAGLHPVQFLTGDPILSTHGDIDHGQAYDHIYVKWPRIKRRRHLKPENCWRTPRSGSDHFGVGMLAAVTVRKIGRPR